MNRRQDTLRFYSLLDRLEERIGGKKVLGDCSGRMNWPQRGVYFFFEKGENRSHTGGGPRVVRVGTHALTNRSKTTLWKRLSQHQGVLKDGGGSHRGSIFRLIVGTALAHPPASWGQKPAPASGRADEGAHERNVSLVIRTMPFLWLAVGDEPGPGSLRGFIERNAIALLSNHGREWLDPPSLQWLGRSCNRDRVRSSGLWNQNHVEESYDPRFLDMLERLVDARA